MQGAHIMDINEAVPIPSFGRHETFHPRYGWLKKAYDCITERPDAFRTDDATIRFGVGKNMVNAIKHWSLAFKITTDEFKGGLRTTRFGDIMFGEGGLDPYLERRETLWILHWLLMSKPCRMPVWWLIMNHMSGTVIDTRYMHDTIQDMVRNNHAWTPPSPATIKRDIDVFLHTYTLKRDRLTEDEFLDCPFRSLRLVKHSGDHIRFTFGPKTGISPCVVAFACANFADSIGAYYDISVSRLLEPGGICNTFRLGEKDIARSLETACRDNKYMTMTDINGESHVTFYKNAETTAYMMLGAAYGRLNDMLEVT